jgi:predicted DNA-binding transcriptional regulator YafY
MRADRLIALLLLLQRRGRVTAAEVAAELEISQRTARRDLEALAMSGVPLYSTHGRGGGWELIGGASTDLTGLSADEARALFLAAGPAVAATPELKSALQKLTSALPEPFQAEAEAATTAFKIDRSGWGQVHQPGQPRFLDQLTDAVVRARRIDLDYENRNSARRVRTVHPLGLVTKRNVWYLLAATEPERADQESEIRTYRVGRVRGVETLDLPAIRPPGFDLDKAWENIVTAVEQYRTTSTVTVKVLADPNMLYPLRWSFGAQNVTTDGDPLPDGRLPITIEAHNEHSFAGQIAGFGLRVEVVDPPETVQFELAALAEVLYDRYCRS